MDEEREIGRGNAFARALRPRPDDERATSPVLYVVVGLFSLVLAAVFVAALVLPPMFMHTLILRGARSGRPAMLALGLVLAAIYFMALVVLGKRLVGRPKPPPDRAE